MPWPCETAFFLSFVSAKRRWSRALAPCYNQPSRPALLTLDAASALDNFFLRASDLPQPRVPVLLNTVDLLLAGDIIFFCSLLRVLPSSTGWSGLSSFDCDSVRPSSDTTRDDFHDSTHTNHQRYDTLDIFALTCARLICASISCTCWKDLTRKTKPPLCTSLVWQTL